MDNIEARLAQCFQTVFPELTPAEVPKASTETVAQWDSVAQITLLTLIGEEFGISVDFEEFEGATSFSAMLERVREHMAHA